LHSFLGVHLHATRSDGAWLRPRSFLLIRWPRGWARPCPPRHRRGCRERAIGTTAIIPVEVVTDRAATYTAVLEELLPAAWHRTEQYANNWIEADHGRLKARLGAMRGLNQDRSARVVVAGTSA
jgi:hypothetical protein